MQQCTIKKYIPTPPIDASTVSKYDRGVFNLISSQVSLRISS